MEERTATTDAGATTKGDEQMDRWIQGRVWRAVRDEGGAATAEYAIITVAAVGIAGLLAIVLRSDEVRGLLTELVHRALTVAG